MSTILIEKDACRQSFELYNGSSSLKCSAHEPLRLRKVLSGKSSKQGRRKRAYGRRLCIFYIRPTSTRARKQVQTADTKVQLCLYVFDLLYLKKEALIGKQLRHLREERHLEYIYKLFISFRC